MRILILGGTGLLGSTLASQLRYHDVQILSRSRAPNTIYGDFATLQSIESWLPLLTDIDVVINAIGIFNETATQNFADIHILCTIGFSRYSY